jgi:hypothetical protein
VIFPKLSVAAVNTVAVRVMPFTVSSPLYPLTLYFQGGPSEEYMHFETALAQAARSRHGIKYPGDYRKPLGEAFDKTLHRVLDIV